MGGSSTVRSVASAGLAGLAWAPWSRASAGVVTYGAGRALLGVNGAARAWLREGAWVGHGEGRAGDGRGVVADRGLLRRIDGLLRGQWAAGDLLDVVAPLERRSLRLHRVDFADLRLVDAAGRTIEGALVLEDVSARLWEGRPLTAAAAACGWRVHPDARPDDVHAALRPWIAALERVIEPLVRPCAVVRRQERSAIVGMNAAARASLPCALGQPWGLCPALAQPAHPQRAGRSPDALIPARAVDLAQVRRRDGTVALADVQARDFAADGERWTLVEIEWVREPDGLEAGAEEDEFGAPGVEARALA